MLVVSRRKNEVILIDGAIEIEVVNVTKATVRVRLSAPRSMQVVRGLVKKELGAEAEPATKANSAGIDALNLTLVSQQVIELGTAITLGVVDVDRSRALFFIDAPVGTNVLASDQRTACCSQNPTARQNLLQFMSPPSERGGAGLEEPSDHDLSRDLAKATPAIRFLLSCRFLRSRPAEIRSETPPRVDRLATHPRTSNLVYLDAAQVSLHAAGRARPDPLPRWGRSLPENNELAGAARLTR